MEEFLSYVHTYGLALVLIAVLGPILYKFFMRVYEEQRQDKKESDAQYAKREQEFMDQLKIFNETLVSVNETSKEIAISNKILVGKLKDDIVELKNSVNDIKDAIDDKNANPQNTPNK